MTLILQCLNGDLSILNDELSKNKLIKIGGQEEVLLIRQKFRNMNSDNKLVQNFIFKEFNTLTQEIFRKIEMEFGRPFHHLQILCINFLLSLFNRGQNFIQFGIGNGKTLIVTAASIIICSIMNFSCIIVVKSSYLQYRDFKKYKNLIEKCRVMASQQDFIRGGITFMQDVQFFKKLKNQNKKESLVLDKVFVLMDEFDCLFDDAKPQQILEKLTLIRRLENFIALTGSTLCNEESLCLKEYFQSEIIRFPSLLNDNEQEIIQRRSQVHINTDQWLQNLSFLVSDITKQVPAILALNISDINKVKQYFKGQSIDYIDLTDFLKKQQLAELQTIIEFQFTQPLEKQTYSVFIISQELGRGTDFPTSVTIEENGGNYLILGDVFTRRNTEQIKGRVCRMQNKGQFQYCLNMKQGGNTYDYIQQREHVLNLKQQSLIESLLNLIRNNKDNLIQTIYNQKYSNNKNNFFKNDEINCFQDTENLELQQWSKEFSSSSSDQGSVYQYQEKTIAVTLNSKPKNIKKLRNENLLNTRSCLKRKPSQQINELENQVLQEQKQKITEQNYNSLQIESIESDQENLEEISKK